MWPARREDGCKKSWCSVLFNSETVHKRDHHWVNPNIRKTEGIFEEEAFERATARHRNVSLASGKSTAAEVDFNGVISLTLRFMNRDGVCEGDRVLDEAGDRLFFEQAGFGVIMIAEFIPAFFLDFIFVAVDSDADFIFVEVRNGAERTINPALLKAAFLWVDMVVFSHHHLSANFQPESLGGGIFARGHFALDFTLKMEFTGVKLGEAKAVDTVRSGIHRGERDILLILRADVAVLVDSADEVRSNFAEADLI